MTRYFVGGCVLLSTAAWGGGIPATQLDAMTVVGEPAPRPATSAAQGVVTEVQLQSRPVARTAELLEFVPGMVATQHSGEGKANQYFLRGFNLDHGTDFATWVDGMPVNLRSHGHGQGYTDLNFLIPEMVESLVYRKGPYATEVGDFSAAGSAHLGLRRELAAPQTTLTLGENGYRRGLLAAAPQLGAGRLLLAGDVSRYEGPWELDQDLAALKLLGRYSQGQADQGYTLTLMAYDNEWTATDQIPRRAVASGAIDRLGFIDPTVGGDSHRYSVSFNSHTHLARGHWGLSAYAIDYALQLYSNFTYFLEDPEDGDQFEQLDERRVYGLAAHRSLPLNAERSLELDYGLQLRHDAIGDVGLFRTRARQRLGAVRRDQVDESSAGLWAELRYAPAPRWRLRAGLRVDGYRFDVDARRPENSGSADDVIVSPKLGAQFQATEALSLYANLGRGFHSNDARGTVIATDPADPNGPGVSPVEPLVAADAVDLGAVLRLGSVAQLAMTAWALELDSELVYVGDGGATEASDASRRRGLEFSAYLTPWPALIVDLDYAYSHARFDIDAAADRIPNAVERVASLGLTLTGTRGWSGGLRLRHLGPAPLAEDNSARSEPTTVLNLRVDYAASESLQLSLSAFNLLDSDDNDITYFYASRLPGEPEAGVEDKHFHPVEPRQLRASLSWRWR